MADIQPHTSAKTQTIDLKTYVSIKWEKGESNYEIKSKIICFWPSSSSGFVLIQGLFAYVDMNPVIRF